MEEEEKKYKKCKNRDKRLSKKDRKVVHLFESDDIIIYFV